VLSNSPRERNAGHADLCQVVDGEAARQDLADALLYGVEIDRRGGGLLEGLGTPAGGAVRYPCLVVRRAETRGNLDISFLYNDLDVPRSIGDLPE
jgi:hypothetical protein